MSQPITLQPSFSDEHLVQIANELFALNLASIKRLPSERDLNVRLTTVDGQSYVLKIANRGEVREILTMQHAALCHLNQTMNETVYPQSIANRAGEWVSQVEDAEGYVYLVRLLTYLPGKPWAQFKPITPALLNNNGRCLAHTTSALQTFTHPAAKRELRWDLKHAAPIIHEHMAHIADPQQGDIVAGFLARFEQEVIPRLPELRQSIIHGDANDYNVLVRLSGTEFGKAEMAGLIDFGDMVYSHTIFELAIALAYVLLPTDDEIPAPFDIQRPLYEMVKGYHAVFPLTELEMALLPTLIAARLCVSVVLSAYQKQLRPDDAYLTISEQPAWLLLTGLTAVAPQLLHYTIRHACGLPPNPASDEIVAWLRANQAQMASILPLDLPTTAQVVDLSVGSLLLGQLRDRRDPHEFARLLPPTAVSRYNEARLVGEPDVRRPASERNTIHLGMDVFVPQATAVASPLDGTIHHIAYETVIIAYEAAGATFYIRFNDIKPEQTLEIGQMVVKGQQIGAVAPYVPSHVHIQLITNLLLPYHDPFPGMVPAELRDVWLSICPDPNLILAIPAEKFPQPKRSKAEILAARHRHLGRNLSISYTEPLKIVRGWQQYLIDETGRPFLDGVNNVAHVGHAHPRVVEAERLQTAVLNTNTRYLHDNIIEYAERLTATLPDPLSVCFFVNSGSEANDLALRLARAYTGQHDLLVLDAAYHGNLTTLIDISPYKFDGKGGKGAPDHVHKLLMPDPYRGRYKGCGAETGVAYAHHVQQAIDAVQADGRGVAAFIAESVLGCGGQIVLPDNYFATVYGMVRQAGGVCIADEVQVGFGRIGSHFWAFETQGVVPDIVTMGKPIGNGHPLAAVVTTPEIAEAFHNGMEYFNTFGGNPVSCAVGLAVLDVIADENLQGHAHTVGDYLLTGLVKLQAKYPLIGDVRGMGLFIGVELVRNHETLEPAAVEASYVVNRLKDHGILLSTDGPLHNVLKFKPPLLFSKDNAIFLLTILDKILYEITGF